MSSGGGMSSGQSAAAQLAAMLGIEMLGNPNITDSDLDGSVRKDILKIKELGPADLEEKGVAKKYGMLTPESPISNAVVYSEPSEQYAPGPVEPLRVLVANNVSFVDTEPEGKIVVFQQDKNYQLPFPGESTVYPGSPLVFDSNAEVLNPIDLSVRWVGKPAFDDENEEIEDKRQAFQFDTKAIVLDISASTKLKNQSGSKNELLSPSEILVFDGEGRFSLLNELDGMMNYRHSRFIGGEQAESGGSSSSGSSSGRSGDAPSSGGGSFPDFGG